MKIFKFNCKVPALAFLFLLSACSTGLYKSESEISVQIDEPNRMRFSGKGAGAGMMLSSSMGPMGIAIGVAIDEGIGKELDETAREGGFSIEELTTSAFQNSNKNLSIRVLRYGYVLARGDYPEDSVMPELILEIEIAEAPQQIVSLKYPQDLVSANEEMALPVYSLQQAKSDPNISITAFRQALSLLSVRLVPSSK